MCLRVQLIVCSPLVPSAPPQEPEQEACRKTARWRRRRGRRSRLVDAGAAAPPSAPPPGPADASDPDAVKPCRGETGRDTGPEWMDLCWSEDRNGRAKDDYLDDMVEGSDEEEEAAAEALRRSRYIIIFIVLFVYLEGTQTQKYENRTNTAEPQMR